MDKVRTHGIIDFSINLRPNRLLVHLFGAVDYASAQHAGTDSVNHLDYPGTHPVALDSTHVGHICILEGL